MIGKIVGDFVVDSFVERKHNRDYYKLKCTCETCGYEEVAWDLSKDRKCIAHNPDAALRGRVAIAIPKDATKEERDKIIEDRYKGQVYGDLIIDSLAENRGNGKIFFYCTCSKCGKSNLKVRLDNIKKNGKTDKCDCKDNLDDIIGKTFGDLTVLSFSRKDELYKKYYICRCNKCKWTGEVRSDDIKQYGHTSKCNCKIIRGSDRPIEERVKDNLTGRTFGKLTVLSLDHITDKGVAMYKCECSCGREYPIVSRSNLLSGNTTQCQKCGYESRGEAILEDLTGRRIGCFTVLCRDREAEANLSGRATMWKCECDCGNIWSTAHSRLVGEDHITCCPECSKANQIKHGMTGTPFYAIWKNMKQRCYNPNNPKYKDYGARGIAMCDEWKEDFMNFYNDMYDSYLQHKQLYPNDTSIDRINNDGNYCKENCRWATVSEQQNNTRFVNKYHIDGYEGEYSVREMIDNGISGCQNYNTIHGRINRGYDINTAILDTDLHYYQQPVYNTNIQLNSSTIPESNQTQDRIGGRSPVTFNPWFIGRNIDPGYGNN